MFQPGEEGGELQASIQLGGLYAIDFSFPNFCNPT